jgi:predicted Zn-dependent protease with MMP-like domain
MSVRMSPQRFEEIVGQALASLPPRIAGYLDNVFVEVADEPSAGDRRRMRLRGRETLFGLYVGVPLTERDTRYANVAPDRIMIYRGPILRACDSEAEAVEQIRVTVMHELGHHFGLDDEDLDEAGYA